VCRICSSTRGIRRRPALSAKAEPLAEADAQVVVAQQLADAVGQSRRFAGRNEKTRLAILDDLTHSAHVGGHGRHAGCCVFERRVGKRLGPAGEHAHVEQRQNADRIGDRTEPIHLAVDSEVASKLPHLAGVGRFLYADDKKSRARVLIEDKPGGMKKRGVILDRPNRGHDSHYTLAIGDAQRLARRNGRQTLFQPVGGHGVSDHSNSPRRYPFRFGRNLSSGFAVGGILSPAEKAHRPRPPTASPRVPIAEIASDRQNLAAPCQFNGQTSVNFAGAGKGVDHVDLGGSNERRQEADPLRTSAQSATMPEQHHWPHRKVLDVAALDAREHGEVEVEKIARQFPLQE
jgi:hypothetical protein